MTQKISVGAKSPRQRQSLGICESEACSDGSCGRGSGFDCDDNSTMLKSGNSVTCTSNNSIVRANDSGVHLLNHDGNCGASSSSSCGAASSCDLRGDAIHDAAQLQHQDRLQHLSLSMHEQQHPQHEQSDQLLIDTQQQHRELQQQHHAMNVDSGTYFECVYANEEMKYNFPGESMTPVYYKPGRTVCA